MKQVDGKLLEKYYTGRCTPEERKWVEAWLESGEAHETPDLPEDIKMVHKEQMWHTIMGEIDIAEPAAKTIPIYKKAIRYAAAACVAFLLVGAGYFMLLHDHQDTVKALADSATDIITKADPDTKTVKQPPVIDERIQGFDEERRAGHVKLNSEQDSSNSSITAKRVKSISGRKYVAIYVKNQPEEFMVFHADNIPDNLPPVFAESIERLEEKS